jgi:hypothetical protein
VSWRSRAIIGASVSGINSWDDSTAPTWG